MTSELLGRLGSRSGWLKRSLWRSWYELLARRYGEPEWTFMNYGYAPLAADEAPGERRERDRYPVHLYRHVTEGVDLRGAAVLEVGCGRGGGCAYMARELLPASVLGVDYAAHAVEFCRRVHRHPGLTFLQGDAEALPCADGQFDAVVNVESSHCYGSMETFLAEVFRVLRPGGHFLWADLRPASGVAATRRQLRDAGFAVERERLITPNVVRALDLMSEGRVEMIERLVPRLLARPVADFAGVRGTRVYESLRAGAVEYVSGVLRKPAPAGSPERTRSGLPVESDGRSHAPG